MARDRQMTEQPENRLAAALVLAQKAMPAPKKDGVNPHFKSSFVTLDELISTTRPVLNDHGLTINQFPSVNELGAPVLVTRIAHFSGEALEYQMPLFLGDRHDMQALGAAITYARRFAWSAALGIASDHDDDGDSLRPRLPRARTSRSEHRMISEDQRRRLFAIAKENAVPKEKLAEMIEAATGQTSTTQIPIEKYDALVAEVQAMAVPF